MSKRFEIFNDRAGAWRWRLKDGNNVKVATSGESFASKANARRAAENVRTTAPGAPIRILEPEAVAAALTVTGTRKAVIRRRP